MNFKLAIAGALLAAGFASPAFAAPYGPYPSPISYPTYHHSQWELIGTRDVSFRAERDTIPAYGNDRARQIMVCVYRQPVRMFDLDVNFANGGHQDVDVRSVIGAGQCTRAIDLYGDRRDIRSVALTYKTANGFRFHGPFWQNALVRVYAR